ncbi:MAG: hypothetical protein F2799_00965 [Actinobacteria bacterium]|uniref:Unannotated protein n=1 Tax=freshwater metagenome TaxID=449393 RepID=A0A6J7CXK1_9ZZZZ|nr:hypothetical protein [Actinomycetota bacterium]
MKLLVVQPDADTPLGALEAPIAHAGADVTWWEPRFDSPPAGPFDGIIILGSEANPDDDRFEPWVGAVRAEVSLALELGIPLLAVCFGAQLLAEEVGGTAIRMDQPEIGWVEIHPVIASSDDPLLSVIPDGGTHLLAWHRYKIKLSDAVARTAAVTVCEQAFKVLDANAWGVQFHLEATGQIVEEWIASAIERLTAERVDVAGIRAGLERYGAEAELIGAEIADRFLAVVEANSAA